MSYLEIQINLNKNFNLVISEFTICKRLVDSTMVGETHNNQKALFTDTR